MTEIERQHYGNLLQAKESELANKLRRRDGIQIETEAEFFDDIQRSAERDFAVQALAREFALLRRVDAALDRLDGGTFGICQECEEEIDAKRLSAVPWAERCVRCQQKADEGNQDGGLSSRW